MKDKTLVFGASLKPHRASNRAIHLLEEYNFPVRAIGFRGGLVANTPIETDFPVYSDIQTITLYMNPRRLEEHWDYLMSLNAKRIIFNPGTEDAALIQAAKNRGMLTEVACTLVLLRTGQYVLDESLL